MGGLDCEVDVVESVDAAVEAEGAVESAEVVVGAGPMSLKKGQCRKQVRKHSQTSRVLLWRLHH